MPSYEYEAVTPEGQRISSVAFGRNLQEVILSLTQKGLQVMRIEDAYEKSDALRTEQPAATPVQADPALRAEVATERPAELRTEPIQTGSQVAPPDLSQRSAFMTNLIGPF